MSSPEKKVYVKGSAIRKTNTQLITDVIVIGFRPGQKHPKEIHCKALIDTGASNTALRPKLISKLHLFPMGKSDVSTAGGTKDDEKVYACDVAIPCMNTKGARATFEIEAGPTYHTEGEFDVLLGMDVLEHADFKTLAFPTHVAFEIDLPGKNLVPKAEDQSPHLEPYAGPEE